jgi:hypothetical protein
MYLLRSHVLDRVRDPRRRSVSGRTPAHPTRALTRSPPAALVQWSYGCECHIMPAKSQRHSGLLATHRHIHTTMIISSTVPL